MIEGWVIVEEGQEIADNKTKTGQCDLEKSVNTKIRVKCDAWFRKAIPKLLTVSNSFARLYSSHLPNSSASKSLFLPPDHILFMKIRNVLTRFGLRKSQG